jgi:pyruvate,water dikinase
MTGGVVWPSAEEVDGFWSFDKMHAPRPLHPLSQDCVMATLSQGFTKAQAEYDCPLVAHSRAFNHYFFSSFRPHPDPAVVADRMSRYLDTLDAKVPLVGRRWTDEWLPMIRARNEAARDIDYSTLSDAELLAAFDAMTDWMREQWYVHGHINFALVAGAKLSDFYEDVLRPSDPTEAYQILQGHHTRPADATFALWDLSRRVRASAELRDAFASVAPSALTTVLRASDDGRAFLAELDRFLYEFGWRSDAVYDLADVPWHEDPTIPLGNIARFAAMPDGDDPRHQLERAVRLREELTAKIRAAVADDPDKAATFEALYDAAMYAVPLTEDHAFYIDQMGVVVFRRMVLAAGDALVRNGVVDDRHDVFLLFRDELRDALSNGGDRRAIVEARRASVAAAAAATDVPRALGTPPPAPPPGAFVDPWFDAVVVRLGGRRPPAAVTDPDVIEGVAGSPGVYTGVARVVTSLAEASDLADGEVMVCEMTLPPWVPMFSIAGAVVADVGGVMSHCAIVAREFAIPAVVGSVDGTRRIATGTTVTVDGTSGKVYLDARRLD